MGEFSKVLHETITYSLIDYSGNSNHFYKNLNLLTDEILSGSNELFSIVDEYVSFIQKNEIEKLRTKEEYFFEILSLGVYLKEYCLLALGSSEIMMKLLAKLYYLRRKNKSIKPYVDYCRGILMTLFLTKQKGNHIEKVDSELFNRVILWLESSGEFREEVKRFKKWQIYLECIFSKELSHLYNKLIRATDFFEAEAEYFLGKYSANIDDYLQNTHSTRKFKEDYIFCGRKKSEYYLAMLGSEIMNRAFKDDFDSTSKKAVLVPACMKIKSAECKAKHVSLDYICSKCDKNCNVHKITKLGEKYNFETHIIPHSSDFTNWLKTWAVGNDIGVVGVACPLNLTTGGLELKDLDIGAQCVLLDYCGCTNHWDEKGIPTSLNENQLLKLLGVNQEARATD